MQLAPANTKRERGQKKISPVAIKQQIVALGTSVTEIARHLGYARNTVSLAIHHPSLYPAVRKRVISHLHLS